jgi:hypothetical protein
MLKGFRLRDRRPLRRIFKMELTQRDREKVRCFTQQFYWKIDKIGECWVWKIPNKAARAFFVNIAGLNYSARQFAWAITKDDWTGPVQAEMLCGKAGCVNPEHMKKGTIGLREFRGGGKVYFLQCDGGGPIKIGFTTKPIEQRVAQLQAFVPETLVILGGIPGDEQAEKDMHLRFRKDRIRRNHEWFRPSEDLLSYLEGLGLRPQRRLEEKIA